MLSKIALVVTGIILLGGTAAMATAPADEGGNVNIEMAVELSMAAASLYSPTQAAPSAFVDDSPKLYLPTSAAPGFRVLDQNNEDYYSLWDQ